MRDRIEHAFDDIRADEALLQKTAVYLRAQRQKREPKSRISAWRLAGALAAMLALAMGGFGYRIFYVTAVAYVGMDINPSVELTLNRMDRVIGAVAYNAEGEVLLREASLYGTRYDKAAATLLAAMEQEGYLRGDALVTVTVQTADETKEQVLCSELSRLISEQLSSAQAPMEAEVFPVTQEVRETAYGCHMSAAKYLAIQELMEVDESATLEEYSDSTIKQIRQRTQACRDEHGDESSNRGGHDGEGRGSESAVGGGHGGESHESESAVGGGHDGEGRGSESSAGGGHGGEIRGGESAAGGGHDGGGRGGESSGSEGHGGNRSGQEERQIHGADDGQGRSDQGAGQGHGHQGSKQ